MQKKVMDIMDEIGYDPTDVVTHPDIVNISGDKYMSNNKCFVDINGERFEGLVSPDKTSVTVFDRISEDEGDIVGTFGLDEDGNLIQEYVMSGTKQIIGSIVSEGKSSSSVAQA